MLGAMTLGSPALGSLVLLSALLGVASCASSTACTQASCESMATVTYGSGLFPGPIAGPYDLVLEGEGDTATARCLDPSAPETADNPEGLTCDGQGFVLDAHPLAIERELTVTIVLLETDESITETVRLDAIEEITPNGPDCPPICVIRNGNIQPAGVGS